MKTLTALALAVTLPALAAGLAVPATPTEDAAVLRVDVFDFGYRDAATGTPVTIAKVGDVVRFTWTSGIHTVTVGAAGQKAAVPGGPDSPTLESGATWDFRAAAAGAFPYTCKLHPLMEGVLVVQA